MGGEEPRLSLVAYNNRMEPYKLRLSRIKKHLKIPSYAPVELWVDVENATIRYVLSEKQARELQKDNIKRDSE